jgi:glucokinase
MFLGIEIGGTKLQIGLGKGDGKIVHLWRNVVQPKSGAAGIRTQIRRGVPELLAVAGVSRADLSGIGVGFGGPVDDRTRSVLRSHQIDGWEGFPLAGWLEKALRLPVALGNDADVAGLAEARFGAGKGQSSVFYITVGSGIGGGLIIDGRIFRGCGQGAAEIGHLRVSSLNAESGEYVEADLEQVASGWAIAQHARSMVARDSILWQLAQSDPEKITTEQVATAASKGDAFTKEILDQALSDLATAICHVVALICPKRIVIGGGVSLIGEKQFFTPLRKLVRQRAFAPFARTVKIVPAALGESVVVHGALALAEQTFAPTTKHDAG